MKNFFFAIFESCAFNLWPLFNFIILIGEDRQLDEENATSTKAHFYVYCKDCPKTLQTGKLRVRCHRCQEGSILIHRDPCGWSDVLDQPGR